MIKKSSWGAAALLCSLFLIGFVPSGEAEADVSSWRIDKIIKANEKQSEELKRIAEAEEKQARALEKIAAELSRIRRKM